MYKYFMLTGPPRSGTTYCAKLFNHYDNLVMLSEPPKLYIPSEPERIYELYNYYINMIKKKKCVPNKITGTYQLPEDYATEKWESNTQYFSDKEVKKDFILAIKDPNTFLNNLHKFRNVDNFIKDFYLAVIIRNPLDCIGSNIGNWGGLSLGQMNQSKQDKYLDRIKTIKFESNPHKRNALTWKLQTDRIIDNLDIIDNLIVYEEFVTNPIPILERDNFNFGVLNKTQIKTSTPSKKHRDKINDELIHYVKDICFENASKLGVDII